MVIATSTRSDRFPGIIIMSQRTTEITNTQQKGNEISSILCMANIMLV